MTRNDFMINPHDSYVAELAFKFATPGSVVRALMTVLYVKPDKLYCLPFNPSPA